MSKKTSSLILMFKDSASYLFIEKHIDFVFLVFKFKQEASSQAGTFSRFLVHFSSAYVSSALGYKHSYFIWNDKDILFKKPLYLIQQRNYFSKTIGPFQWIFVIY